MARMIRAGIYNKVVILQQIKPPTPAANGKIVKGGSVNKNEWEDVKRIRASIEPIQGREYFSGAFQIGETVIRVRIRYQPDIKINNKMRIKYGARILKIENVIDSKERHEELQLICKEGEAHNG